LPCPTGRWSRGRASSRSSGRELVVEARAAEIREEPRRAFDRGAPARESSQRCEGEEVERRGRARVLQPEMPAREPRDLRPDRRLDRPEQAGAEGGGRHDRQTAGRLDQDRIGHDLGRAKPVRRSDVEELRAMVRAARSQRKMSPAANTRQRTVQSR
jgi:hypothetical protein